MRTSRRLCVVHQNLRSLRVRCRDQICRAQLHHPADFAAADGHFLQPQARCIDRGAEQFLHPDRRAPAADVSGNAQQLRDVQHGDRFFGDGKPEGIDAGKVDSSKDQLVVATNAAFEPFEYKQGDKFYGIDMEVAAGLAKYLNKELVIVDMSFDAVCLSVSQGKADIAMAGLTIKPEREEFVTFSDSYYAASQKVVTLTSDTTFDSCKTADDVVAVIKGMENGTKAGCQNGTTGQLYLEGDEEMEFEGFANITTSGYDSGSLAIQNVINGNLKFVVIDEAPANAIVKALNAVNK